LHKIKRYVAYDLPFARWLLKPLVAAAAAGWLARTFADGFLLEALGLRVGLALAVGLLMAVYFGGVLLSGCITRQEVRALFKR
jgi:hypothetical protein